MPEHPYVINLQNNPVTTYRYRMPQKDLARQFSRWYRISHGNKKTVCLLGTRETSLFSVTAAFSTRNTVIVENAGFPSSLRALYAASLFTTGRSATSGMRMLFSDMITTDYMISIIWRG